MLNRAELDQSQAELGQRLAASRKAARLSQTELAGLIGCIRSTVLHIEHARRRSDRNFWKLASRTAMRRRVTRKPARSEYS